MINNRNLNNEPIDLTPREKICCFTYFLTPKLNFSACSKKTSRFSLNRLDYVAPEAEACATRLDGQRIYRAERIVSDATKKVIIQKRVEQVANPKHLRDEEGELYGSRIAEYRVSFSNHVSFCHLCLNAFSQKSCFSNLLVRVRLEVSGKYVSLLFSKHVVRSGHRLFWKCSRVQFLRTL